MKKLIPFSEASTNRWHGKGNKPLRSAKEMAAEFGISVQSLGAKMQKDPEAPKPRIVNINNRANGRNSWYDPDAVRAWWKAHNAEVSGAGTASAGLPGYDACGNGERK